MKIFTRAVSLLTLALLLQACSTDSSMAPPSDYSNGAAAPGNQYVTPCCSPGMANPPPWYRRMSGG